MLAKIRTVILFLVMSVAAYSSSTTTPPNLTADDPYYPMQYYLHGTAEHGISVETAWDAGLSGKGVTVAIIDTGIDAEHIDAPVHIGKGQHYFWREEANGRYMFTENGDHRFCNYYSDSDIEDQVGHGSLVASIIAAPVGNGQGIAGIAPGVTVLPLRSDGLEHGMEESSTLISCIDYAVELGADIINMSWGSCREPEELHNAVKRAYDAGCILIASAGNCADDTVSYPEAWKETISVGATDQDGYLADFSRRNAFVDVCAPGVGIYGNGLFGTSSICYGNGTSCSAAIVSGVAALCKEVWPEMTQDDFLTLLEVTCDSIPHRDGESKLGFGCGIINMERLVAELENKDVL